VIYGPINDNFIWRIKYINKHHTLCDYLDIVNMIKIGRVRWLGQLFRMQELDPCSKFTVLKQQSTRLLGKRTLKYSESVRKSKEIGLEELET
jgi:hypothetical protein